jgi:putative flippase GtrA
MKPARSSRREVSLYLLFGIVTSVLAFLTYLAVFGIAEHWLHISMEEKTALAYTVTYITAQALQWLVALLAAFYTNRKWVFTEADHGKGTLWHQLWLFSGSRVFTFFLDLAATYGLIHLLSLWLTPDNAPVLLGVKLDAELWAKVAVSILVIATNYFLSKLLVFRKKQT